MNAILKSGSVGQIFWADIITQAGYLSKEKDFCGRQQKNGASRFQILFGKIKNFFKKNPLTQTTANYKATLGLVKLA